MKLKLGISFRSLLFVSFFVLLLSCQPSKITPQVASNDMAVSTDVKTLGKYINLPSPPIRVFWQTMDITKPSLAPGPTDWSLMGVLTFSEQAIENIMQKSVRSQQMNRPYIQEQFVLDWFPLELKNSLTASETPGFWRINQDGYEPEIFEKSPLLHGYFVRVGKTSDLFLYLHTQ